MNKQSKKPVKPISKKPTVQDPFKEKSFSNLSEEQSQLFETKLSEVLENTFPKKAKVNWGEMCREKLPRRLRREKINELKQEIIKKQISEKQINVDNQKFVFLGFNSTVKNIQTNHVSVVLINSSLPSKLVEILQPLCKMKKIPFLGLEGLDRLSRDQLGYLCSVIGISSQEENPFSDIVDLALQNSDVSKDEICKETTKRKAEQGASEKILPKDAKTSKPTEVRNLHLKRSSRHSRVFLPPSDVEPSSEPAKKRQRLCDESPVTNYLPTLM